MSNFDSVTNGIPNDYNCNCDTKSFAAFQIIEKLVKELNLNIELPIHIRHKSSATEFENSELTAVLIGEQHPGGNYKGISYARSNHSVTELLLKLYNSEELQLSDALKEGVSRLEASVENTNKVELEKLGIGALEILVNLKPSIKAYASEPVSLILESSLLAYFYTSFPAANKYPEIERERILEIIKSNLCEERFDLLKKLSKAIQNKFKLGTYEKIKLQYGEIKIPFLKEEEPEELRFQVLSEFSKLSKIREEKIAQEFTRFKAGIHPIVLGEFHLPNMQKELEKLSIPVITLSPFV